MTPTVDNDPNKPRTRSAQSTAGELRHASGSAAVGARVATMSSGYGTEYAFRAGGWVEVRHSDAPRFLARFAPDEAGRLVPVALVLDPARAIDSTMLQRLRLVSVEAYVNRPGVRERVLDYLSHSANNPRQDILKSLTFELPLISQDAVVHPQPAVARAQALDATVKIGQATEMQTAQPSMPMKSHRLGRAVDFGSAPPGRKPDWFYQEVANQYGRLVAASNRPAAEMAELHAIPVTTVHRWVKEARRRGFLGPGRKGRRG